MKQFMDRDFMLSTECAKRLYHDYAEKMPILDYHCHISPKEIAIDRKFENITQMWLNADHYKWRQMRANGVEEYYITGSLELLQSENSSKSNVSTRDYPAVQCGAHLYDRRSGG